VADFQIPHPSLRAGRGRGWVVEATEMVQILNSCQVKVINAPLPAGREGAGDGYHQTRRV